MYVYVPVPADRVREVVAFMEREGIAQWEAEVLTGPPPRATPPRATPPRATPFRLAGGRDAGASVPKAFREGCDFHTISIVKGKPAEHGTLTSRARYAAECEMCGARGPDRSNKAAAERAFKRLAAEAVERDRGYR